MSYTERAYNYALQIVEGKTSASKLVKATCQRFMDDLKRDDIVLTDEGERWCRFLEKQPHVKGKWAFKQEFFKLSDWQIFCTINIYGWLWSESHRRRFRTVYIEVPRKNGKSFWVACLGLGHLLIDNEYGAEIYCGATSEKQAWEIFRPAKQICDRTEDMRDHYGIESNARNINVLSTGSRFEPVIGKPGDGSSPSCAIVDEFHEHPDSDQVDTFETGMGARDNPMLIMITTAGSDIGGPCFEKRHDVINIIERSVEDDSVFGLIYGLDEDDKWDTVASQKKANPNYGISVDADFLKGQLAQAKRSAVKQASYKTKHLNMWVGAKQAWMNMLAYQACRKKHLDMEDYKGRECYIGIDLASKLDLADMAILFPPEKDNEPWAVFFKHYLPEDRIEEGGYTRYKAWHADGWINATHGNVLDYSYIEDDLIQMKSDYQIMEVPYDPFQATQFSTRMVEAGFPMVEYGATVKNFSEPMKELEAKILKKEIVFQFDPVAMWAFGNVVAKEDKKGNVFPDKERKENKIDPVVALIMAVARATLHEPTGSVYDQRGVRTL